MWLIAGLGNPGEKYARTRHNIGFMAVECLGERQGIRLKRKGYQALYGTGQAAGVPVTLLLPQTFMNLSGVSVKAAARALEVGIGQTLVVHDDIDLPFGQLRLKRGGGHGGHNGLRSLHEHLGSGDYLRLRLGVGRPAGAVEVTGHVLGSFSGAEQRCLEPLLTAAADALESVLRDGIERAMNRFNNLDITTPERL